LKAYIKRQKTLTFQYNAGYHDISQLGHWMKHSLLNQGLPVGKDEASDG